MMESISWWGNKEEVLLAVVNDLNKLFDGTKYRAARNSTKGEKNVDLFVNGETARMGYVWPLVRTKKVHLTLPTEAIEVLRARMDLPDDVDVKEGRYLSFRSFKNISYEQMWAILKELKNCY